jgi:Glycosyl transferase family 2
MRIACICSTKNEGDIIEAFVRLNGRICTSFFFVDESTDNTREILANLVKERYDVNYLAVAEGGYNQPNPTKAYLSLVRREHSPDWIFLLDADEIIVADDKEKLIQEMKDIPPATYLSAEWKTYVPITLDYFESKNPLSECFALRKEKGESYRKISLPGPIADNMIPTPGNHAAKSLRGAPLSEQAAKSYYLAHFPVRSAEQIVVKNLIATHNLTTRIDAGEDEGIHVRPILQLIRRRNYLLTLADLGNIAVNYGFSNQRPTPRIEDEIDRQANLKLATELRYADLARINVVARLDSEIERLSLELRKTKLRRNSPFWFRWLSR